MDSVKKTATNPIKPRSRAMKNFSAEQLTLIISIGVIFICSVFWLIDYYFQLPGFMLIIWISGAFLLTYRAVKFILRRYIYDRIKPIYKAIHNVNQSDKSNGMGPDSDLIGHVEKEVAQYRKDKSSEIEKLKELEKYRRDFLGNVSHELKTPIFNIQGYILTLLDGGINDQNINMLYLKRTEKSINRIITIVEDLEAISRLESGELQLILQEFNILKVTDEVFEMHQLLATEKNITLRTNSQSAKPILVLGDKKRIIIALSNLVVNAIKYGKKDGFVKVGFYDMDDKWLIEVSDNGIGIETKHLPRIFERFYRIDKSRSREDGGTGLGLAIVKHIVDAHKQTLTVKSVPGEGTSFTFTLDKKNKAT